MIVELLDEPELEFGGGGRHIDTRFGLLNHGPLDAGQPRALRELRVGIVGCGHTAEPLSQWLEKCRGEIAFDKPRQPNLHPRFPGFSADGPFECTLVTDSRWIVDIEEGRWSSLLRKPASRELTEAAVEMFVEECKRVARHGVQVIVCAPSSELLEWLDTTRRDVDPTELGLDEADDEETTSAPHPAFHDLLKARALDLPVPIQMVRGDTYGLTRLRANRQPGRRLQDEATRAWNFFTALYYKAGGALWRLPRASTDLASCFIGISFFRSADTQRVLTSMAQVFNERGEGIIVQGAPAISDREDRQPHLAAADAADLIGVALAAYRREHKTTPARVVVHKTSAFNGQEVDGMRAALLSERIEEGDLVWARRSYLRLFRYGLNPPLRGTFLSLDCDRALVYLRGSVDFFKTYPGMYVPRPIEFVHAGGPSSIHALGQEILALSKLNWNNTQFDGGEPMTLRAARRLGDIMKNVTGTGSTRPEFRFLM